MTDIERLKNIIDKKGLRMSWIAEKMGVTRQCLNHKMTGRSEFSRAQVAQISEILGLSKTETFEIFLRLE